MLKQVENIKIENIIPSLLRKKSIEKKHRIKHLAIECFGFRDWAKKNKIAYYKAYSQKLENIFFLLEIQAKYKIPLLTVHISSPKLRQSKEFLHYMAELNNFLLKLLNRKEINEHRLKISVLGKWYDLSGYVVETIKKITRETKENDTYYLNLCINYDGQEEIINAFKLIFKKITETKLTSEEIDDDIVKENLYSSYFLPPDLIIKTKSNNSKSDLLLWDSVYAKTINLDKPWVLATKNDIIKIINAFSE